MDMFQIPCAKYLIIFIKMNFYLHVYRISTKMPILYFNEFQEQNNIFMQFILNFLNSQVSLLLVFKNEILFSPVSFNAKDLLQKTWFAFIKCICRNNLFTIKIYDKIIIIWQFSYHTPYQHSTCISAVNSRISLRAERTQTGMVVKS